MPFRSILHQDPPDPREARELPEFFHDLNLDQVVESAIAGRKEYELAPFFYAPLHDADSVAYRHEVMRDLEGSDGRRAVDAFAQAMREVRMQTAAADQARERYERARWIVDAAAAYALAVESLRKGLESSPITSRGLLGLREYLDAYTGSDAFRTLAAETTRLAGEFAGLRYCLLIHEGRYTVRRFEKQPDYTVEVERTFDKFRRGATKSYLAELSSRSGMNHIQANIVLGLAKLFPEMFASLEACAAEHAGFLDPTIARFDREVQFYLSYLDHMGSLRAAGLRFCYPRVSGDSKEVLSHGSFDLALAAKLVSEKASVVTNDFLLRGRERTFVVSGPNQGGKTTFARMFGQLHYLAALGLPVPGTEAQLFLFDKMFTHFEREENIANLRGKLHDDLVRIRRILDAATPSSIIIMNELFSSTTVRDAVFLSRRIMSRISELDVLGVWVTFLTELATFDDKTVSMVSQVDPRDPAVRTFKLERRPAEGLAYALAVAQKHGVTFDRIKERLSS